MGLLSRIGRQVGKRFSPRMAESRFDDWSLVDYAAVPLVHNAPLMGGVGALGGAAMNPDNPGEGAMTGAALGAGLGVGIPYGVAGRRIAKGVGEAFGASARVREVAKAVRIAARYHGPEEAQRTLRQAARSLDPDEIRMLERELGDGAL